MKRVFIVENEYTIAIYYEIIIKELGYEVVGIAHSGKEAIRLVDEIRPEVVFMDINMEQIY